jgi:hypothetical protein
MINWNCKEASKILQEPFAGCFRTHIRQYLHGSGTLTIFLSVRPFRESIDRETAFIHIHSKQFTIKIQTHPLGPITLVTVPAEAYELTLCRTLVCFLFWILGW